MEERVSVLTFYNIISIIILLSFGVQVQWNLDLTKSLGTGQICLLNGGFVILKTSI